MNWNAVVIVVYTLLATSVLAHEGVKNPAVMARMMAMSEIGANTKILGEMAKGQTEFDAESAQKAAAAISQDAAHIQILFEAPETDPKSEALPRIWDEYDNFSQQADALQIEAEKAAQSISEPADLVAAVRALGETCKSCHSVYRK